MTSPQLVEYIERELEEKGVRPKVIPPEDELSKLADEMCRRKLANWAEEALLELVSFDEIAKGLSDEFVGEFELGQAKRYIEDGFEEDRTHSWRDALANKLSAIQEGHTDTLKDALRLRIAEKVKGGGG